MTTVDAHDLPALSGIRSAQALFARLSPPASLAGCWRAEFVGPGWLRWLAPRGMWASPLYGWRGKRFDAEGQGLNLVRRGGRVQGVIPMRQEARASRLDGRPVLASRYAADAPWLLRGVADEFRQLHPDGLLGLMTIDRPGLRGLALPFLLHRVADESSLA